MPDMNVSDEFAYHHRKIMNDIRRDLDTDLFDHGDQSVANALRRYFTDFVERLLDELDKDPPLDPGEVFRLGCKQLKAIDDQIFVMSNMLERLKAGDDPDEIISRFKDLGLTDISLSDVGEEDYDSESDNPTGPGVGDFGSWGGGETTPRIPGNDPLQPDHEEWGIGRLWNGVKSLFKKLKLKTIQTLVNALKAVPGLQSITPSISISASGPSISFEIALETGPITLDGLVQWLEYSL